MSVKRGTANISIPTNNEKPTNNKKRKTMVISPQKKKQMDKTRTLVTLAGPTTSTIPKKDGGSFTKTTVIVVEKNGNSFPFQNISHQILSLTNTVYAPLHTQDRPSRCLVPMEL